MQVGHHREDIMQLVRAKAYFALLSAVLLWSGNWIAARAVRDDISPGLITFCRVLIVIAVLAPFVRTGLRQKLPLLAWRDWAIIAGLAVTGGGLHNAMQYLGLQYTTATNGTLFTSMSPIFILLMAGATLGERIGPLQRTGVAVSFAGVLTIALRGDASALAALAFNGGDLLCLLSMLLFSAYTVLLRMRRDRLDIPELLTVMQVLAALTLLPWLAWDLAFDARAHFNANGVAALLYSAIGSMLLAYACWSYAIPRLGAARCGPFMYLMPVFGVVLAAIFLREYPQWFHFAGIALIFSGIALSSFRTSKAASNR
jgi:drug/metabolite transporter (DMT)-like permease